MPTAGESPCLEKAEERGRFPARDADGGEMADGGRSAREIVLR
jgi:hypothetical protein